MKLYPIQPAKLGNNKMFIAEGFSPIANRMRKAEGHTSKEAESKVELLIQKDEADHAFLLQALRMTKVRHL
jgi:hypothetical protein